jgi:monoamine oxidase
MGLETRPFVVVHDDNRYYLRHRASRAADGTLADGYELKGSERGRSPADLLAAAFDRIVPGAMQLTDPEWQDAKHELAFRGRPLYEWTCRDALLAVMSAEAYRLIVDSIGYSAIVGTRNAADAIPYVVAEMKPEADDQVAVVGGMNQLPRTIAARVEANGGAVHLGHALDRFEAESAAGGAVFRLHFEGGISVLARRIILALPRPALEAVAARSAMLQSSEFGRLAGSVNAHDAAKLFLTYERTWWRDAGVQGHRLVTDLPLRKVFYFDRIDGADGDGRALLLASYTDTTDVGPWRALAGHVVAPAPATGGGLGGAARWDAYAASPAQISEAQRQLKTVHGIPEIPEPTGAAFMDWGADGRGGGWYFWRAGVRSWEVMDRIIQPDAASQVFVCGDAYSVSQGWIEGSLETADQVVNRLS